MNRLLIVVEDFEYPNDARSYAVIGPGRVSQGGLVLADRPDQKRLRTFVWTENKKELYVPHLVKGYGAPPWSQA